MGTTCDQCRQSIRGAGHRTTTRLLCDKCYDQFAGLAVGYSSSGTVEGAISTSGWFQRLKKRKDPSP